MARIFVGIGSNIEPEVNVRQALRMVASRVRVTAVSTVYLTEPVGRPEQAPYYNLVAEIRTELPPPALKQDVLRPIEEALGRVRGRDRFAPRTIDLDLLLYGDLILRTQELVLPDPDILDRPFLIKALYELAPGLVLPGTSVSIAKAARALKDPAFRSLDTYTASLREELHHVIRP